MSRRHELIEAFEAFLDAHADEDADDWTLDEVYADLVVEVAADITRQSPVVEVSYDPASLAVVAVYHFEDGARTTFVDVPLYAQFTHAREVMHQRAQAAEAMVERLIVACATALARAEPSATLSYEPSTYRLVLKYPRGREVRHHVCGVPGHIVRTKNARIAEVHAALGDRLDRERAEFERGRAEGAAGACERIAVLERSRDLSIEGRRLVEREWTTTREYMREELRQAHERIDSMEAELSDARVRVLNLTKENNTLAHDRDVAFARLQDAIERERHRASDDVREWTEG